MPLPFLSLVPKSARAALPMIQSGVRQGLSAREIHRRLKASGMKISRGRTVNPTVKALKALEQQGRNVKFVSHASVINTRRLPPAITNMRRRFSYRFRVVGKGPLGPVERYINVATDSSTWTRGMIEDQARDFAEGTGDSGQLSEVEVYIEHGQQRAESMDFAATPGGMMTIGQ